MLAQKRREEEDDVDVGGVDRKHLKNNSDLSDGEWMRFFNCLNYFHAKREKNDDDNVVTPSLSAAGIAAAS